VPQIEVTFDIDANGILSVSAKDQGTGKEQKISITGSSGLDKEEVENLKREAEAHATEDEALKARVEARNELDNIIYQAEKQITDLGEKIPAEKKTELEAAITEAKAMLENQEADAAALKAPKDKIMGVMQSFAEDLYGQTGAEGAAQPEGDAGDAGDADAADSKSKKDDDDAVDADFEVVDEDKEKK
jgi:molecular chaperone DnaK